MPLSPDPTLDPELPKSARFLLGWGARILAPDTFERTLAAARADLAHELAAADPAARRRLLRGAPVLLLRVLVGALAADRKAARRGVSWWLFAAPLFAVVAGLFALPAELAPPAVAQLAFLGAGLVFGFVTASTPRRVLTHEAAAAGWIAVALIALLPLYGTAVDGATRWLPLGPLSIHLATLTLPFIALALAALGARDRLAHALALAVAWQLALMPSADLAATLIAAVVSLTLALATSSPARRLVQAGLIALAAAGPIAWAAAHDPVLAASPLAEGALGAVGAAEHPGALLALAALLLACAAPLWPLARRLDDRLTRGLALALSLSLVLPLALNAALATPLPLIGFGGSAIVATFVGLGALLSVERGARTPRLS